MDLSTRDQGGLHRGRARFLLALHRDNGCRSSARRAALPHVEEARERHRRPRDREPLRGWRRGWRAEQRPRPEQRDCKVPRTFCKAEIAGRLNGFFIYRAKCSRERFVTCRDKASGFYSTFQLRGQSRRRSASSANDFVSGAWRKQARHIDCVGIQDAAR